jgi:hypothetical protein
MSESAPTEVADFATQVVEYVRRSLGVELEYNSETLPVLDHYLRQVPETPVAARELVIASAGAYYGEVVRRTLGGSWQTHGEPDAWRLVLPGGLSFAPAGFVAAAMDLADVDDYDTGFDAPPKMREVFEQALDNMSPVTEEQYYSLCGRFDTIEHVQDVLFARAAQIQAEQRKQKN